MHGFAPDERTVAHVLRQAVDSHADKIWIAHGDARLSYGDLDIQSNRIANGLLSQGVKPGDTALFMLPDVPEFVATWIACSKTGIVEVPVNTAYRGAILTHVVNDSLARCIVCEAEHLDRLDAVSGELTSLERIFVRTGDASAFEVPAGLRDTFDIIPFKELISDDASPLDHVPAVSDLKAIMYTSGTTGPSKGVMVAQAHAFEYAAGCGGCLDVGTDDVYYTAGLPLFHVAGKWGVIYAAAIHGATAAVPAGFSAGQFWDDVRSYRATTTFLLGAMANFLQRQPEQVGDRDTPLDRVLMCPLLPDVDRFSARFGTRVATAYGSTEVNAPVFMAPGTPVHDVQLVGCVRGDKFEVRILDEQDRELEPGLLGEIAVRPAEPWITMLGYWGQPDHTVAMWRNQWLHSGDAGRCDTQGRIYFVDRIKDAIRRRGENISSMEVEGIVSQHPAIAECAVYPVASEYSEQDVAVAIVCKPDADLEMEQLIRWLEPQMAYFMVPRYVTVFDDLPKTPTGKIQKYTLREQGVTGRTWDREASGIKLAR